MAAPRLNRALLLVALSAAYFVATLPYPAAAERNAAAPNANEVLPTPVNVEEACTKEVFHSLTHHYRSCSRSFFHVEDPDEDCCEGLAHFYGPQSPMPSRNCFCDATYAAWFTKM
ncbi:hypothetical protein KFL_001220050 [Klebsormidium nitens]|uniref:Prolamin-like domain-containing protein n=1 Tax=Klebsormidium nitens TaxID=105231 RepID=A0A1Y1I1W0_KLENI|nr:hypothetical protein KFL_001220050 [Klebsormidium nitens]|eukprot:GAQ82736.1 hypothetical protein KFL_001220050 [Klebsormidium nitens]